MRLNPKLIARQVMRVGAPGVFIVGLAPRSPGESPLIYIHDEQELNTGASATHAMDSVLRYIDASWRDKLSVRDATFVHRNHHGEYDLVVPRWDTTSPSAGWKSLVCEPWQARSEQAFTAFLGERAAEVREAMTAYLARHAEA